VISDEMLAKAAAQANAALVAYWENCPLEEHAFSARFQRKMRRLIQKVKHPYLYPALRSAACLLLVLLISAASVLTFNVEARAEFVRWVKKVYEDSVIYEFFGEESETASLDYRLTWVPEGYEVVDEFISDTQRGAKYRKGNSKKDVFVVNWYLMSEDRKLFLQMSNIEYKCYQVMINDCTGSFYQSTVDSESNGLIWFDEELGVGFDINSFLPMNDMIKIAEGIKLS